MVADRKQGVQSSRGIIRVKRHDYIHIPRQADKTVGIHRQAADDKVSDPGVVQRPHDCFDTADFHGSMDSFASGASIEMLVEDSLQSGQNLRLLLQLHERAQFLPDLIED